MRRNRPPCLGWYSNAIDKYCLEWLSNAPLNAVDLKKTRFAEWYMRDFPRSVDPVLFGFLFAFEGRKGAYPLESYCRLKKLREPTGYAGRHFKPPKWVGD